MNRTKIAVAATLALSLSAAAHGEELFPTTEKLSSTWGIGLGMLSEDEGYAGGSSEMEALPVLFYQGDRFRLLGPQAEFNLLRGKRWAWSLRGEYRFDGFDPEEEKLAILDGMEEREASLHLGTEVKYTDTWGTLTGEYLWSVGASKGSRASLYYSYAFEAGAWTIAPKVGVERYDEKFTDYYYGVRQHEATDLRPHYAAEASTNVDVGIDFQRHFGDHHLLVASLKYRRFGDSIKDSPLIDASGQPRATLAYIYTF